MGDRIGNRGQNLGGHGGAGMWVTRDSVVRDQGWQRSPALTAVSECPEGALLLDQLRLRLRKLGARGLQLRLRPQAWEGGKRIRVGSGA